MWLAQNWQDYQLLDCSGGERLERWGDKILIRPDPQVLWNTPKKHPLWKQADGRYLRSSSGGGHWEARDLSQSWPIHYNNMTFLVRPMHFKHMGLFPEQAVNWDYIAGKIRHAGRPIRVLNLFGYTGAATLAAASAGASVCHVDAAKGMVAWGRENTAASGLSDKPIRWIVDDCAKFVEREIRRGHTYDVLMMDPPSYGRGPSGQTWKLETDLWPFLLRCRELLSAQPLFVLINIYTTGLAPAAIGYITRSVLEKPLGGHTEYEELGLPVLESGLALPCGCACRWSPD